MQRSRVHSLWLLVDHCVLRNWDRILVRAVKGLISRAGMVSICPLLWQRDVKLQQTNNQEDNARPQDTKLEAVGVYWEQKQAHFFSKLITGKTNRRERSLESSYACDMWWSLPEAYSRQLTRSWWAQIKSRRGWYTSIASCQKCRRQLSSPDRCFWRYWCVHHLPYTEWRYQ